MQEKQVHNLAMSKLSVQLHLPLHVGGKKKKKKVSFKKELVGWKDLTASGDKQKTAVKLEEKSVFPSYLYI